MADGSASSLQAPGGRQRDAGTVTTPAQFVGHRIGDDCKLVSCPRIVEYFELLARRIGPRPGPRCRKDDARKSHGRGPSSRRRPTWRSDEHRDIARRLPRRGARLRSTARQLADRGKAIVAITLNLHSTEIASSQMALELAYHLATDDSADHPAHSRQRDPAADSVAQSRRPGMVCDWYDKGLGTPLEGGRLPWLYHAYAGHDNNRDWFMLNLVGNAQRHAVAVPGLVPGWPPRSTPDGPARAAPVRAALLRSHQPERASADLAGDCRGGRRDGRAPRGTKLRRSRVGGHLRRVAAGRHGHDALVAQRARPHHGNGERARSPRRSSCAGKDLVARRAGCRTTPRR